MSGGLDTLLKGRPCSYTTHPVDDV